MWHSPTAMSAASTFARGLSIIAVLPLLLTKLGAPEIAVWYLLMSAISLQVLADLGFAPTVARFIAHAMGGAPRVGDLRAEAGTGQPDRALVERVWSAAGVVYSRLSVVSILALAAFGTLALVRPMEALADPRGGWISWGVVVVMSGVVVWGNAYAAYLQGVNEITLLRRWETLTTIASIMTSFFVLLAGGGLLALVVANQSWMLVSVLRNRGLARSSGCGRIHAFQGTSTDHEMIRIMWPGAWRSGLGVAFSRGISQASGFMYAQFAQPAALASYLLGFRFVQFIADLSQAPFYSKLPTLASLRAQARHGDQLALAKRGMRLAYWLFVLGFWVVGLGAPWVLTRLGSRAPFVSPALWALLGLGFFAERYGAMHIQLYSTTNHIIWHVASGVTGLIYLAVTLLALGPLGVYAFPLGFLLGNVGFYAWYSALHVYRTFALKPLTFEATVAIPPALAMLAFGVLALLGPR